MSTDWYAYEKLLYAFFQKAGSKIVQLLVLIILIVLSPLILLLVCVLPFCLRFCLGDLPHPRGPYSVGMEDTEWRVEKPGNDATVLKVRLFYPTNDKATAKAKYLTDPPLLYSAAYAINMGMPAWLARHLMSFLPFARLPVQLGAKIATPESDHRFPLVIFSHGLLGSSSTYSSVCLGMASHGFYVVAVEHKDGTASVTHTVTDGQTIRYAEPPPHLAALNDKGYAFRNGQLRQRVLEVQGVLKHVHAMAEEPRGPLRGVVDPSQCALVGHSFGGATVVETVAELSTLSPRPRHIPQFVAGVCLDAWLFPVSETSYSKLAVPLAFINTKSMMYDENTARFHRVVEHLGRTTPAGTPLNQTRASAKTDAVMVEIPNTRHQDQSDLPALLYYLFRAMAMAGKRDPRESLRLTTDFTLAFILMHLDTSRGLGQEMGGWVDEVERMTRTGQATRPDFVVHTHSG